MKPVYKAMILFTIFVATVNTIISLITGINNISDMPFWQFLLNGLFTGFLALIYLSEYFKEFEERKAKYEKCN